MIGLGASDMKLGLKCFAEMRALAEPMLSSYFLLSSRTTRRVWFALKVLW